MSLYNLLFGENKDTNVLLGVIELTKQDFSRFRDIFLNKEGTKIIVLTRLGGGNRKEYKERIEILRRNKYYIRDYDDDYDNTYAYFEFKIQDKYLDMCKNIAPKEDRPSLKEMFEKEIEEMQVDGSDAQKRAEKIMDKIINSDDTGSRYTFCTDYNLYFC